jgi:hypothetical protein
LYDINTLMVELSEKYRVAIEDCSVNTFRPGTPNPTHSVVA